MATNLNTSERLRLAGFKKLLAVNGKRVVASTGETVTVLMQEETPLVEPFEVAQQKSMNYTRIMAVASEIAAPRSVTSFTEVLSGRVHRVIEFKQLADAIQVSWLVDTQRT